MKTLMILLLALDSLHAADVRIIETNRVDLAPIHEWADRGRKDERPMPQWKFLRVESFQQAIPWSTGHIQVDGKEHKMVYLKNVPEEIVQYFNEIRLLETQIKTLEDNIALEKERYNGPKVMPYSPGSESDQNWRVHRADLVNKESDLKKLKDQLTRLKSKERTSDLATYTGQMHNNLEVWDFGVKQ